ncbi:uncharacterized protein LOC127751019 [Frankliniella occidentalis]|uniref:Uncharacterized protein LOC127751019 n=1 Tax=Frankliniella occidentalis TaxID=133901 RepID=A0A9C6X628_FRAOC|nr:uncharacterized protein LOC127751019 [Frankliniella occidentalis]
MTLARLVAAMVLVATLVGHLPALGDDVAVVETKAVHVTATNHLVATGYFDVSFVMHLPNTTIEAAPSTQFHCVSMLPDWPEYCSVFDQLDNSSTAILLELGKVLSFEDKVPLKPRRSLLPFLGEFRRWLEGTATERQLDSVITSVNKLGTAFNALQISQSEIVNITRINAVKIESANAAIRKDLQSYHTAISQLANAILEHKDQMNYVLKRLLLSIVVNSRISLFQTHLSTIRSVHASCRNGRLSSLVVPEAKLHEVLLNNTANLYANSVKFLLNSISQYYDFALASCTMVEPSIINITLPVPVTSARSAWRAFDVTPLKFLSTSLTCQIVERPLRFASDGVHLRALADPVLIGSSSVYLLPRFHSPSGIDVCLHDLFHINNVSSISKKCPMMCNDITQTTVQLLNSSTFSILNPRYPVQIICLDQMVRILYPINSGRYEVSLPCECAAQDMSPKQEIIIHPRSACIATQSMHVDASWAGDRLSSVELFVPKSHVAAVLASNLTLAPLMLVTPSPLPSDSHWENLPLVGGGKVEYVIWSILCVLALLGSCWFLESRFQIFSGCWRVGLCAWRWCCVRKSTASPSPPPRAKDQSHHTSEDIEMEERAVKATAALRQNRLAQSSLSLDELHTSREVQRSDQS